MKARASRLAVPRPPDGCARCGRCGACRSTVPSPRGSARRSAARPAHSRARLRMPAAAGRDGQVLEDVVADDQVERPRATRRCATEPCDPAVLLAEVLADLETGVARPAGSAAAAGSRISPSPQPTSRIERTSSSPWRTKAATRSARRIISACVTTRVRGRGRSGDRKLASNGLRRGRVLARARCTRYAKVADQWTAAGHGSHSVAIA